MTAPQLRGTWAVFLDLDGTLCLSDRGPSPATLRAMDAARKNGHKIFLNTGRAMSMIPPDILSLPWDGIVAGLGAHVEVGGRTIFDRPYPPQAVERLVELFQQARISFLVETDVYAYMDLSHFQSLGLEETQGVNREVASLIRLVRRSGVREWTEYRGAPVYNIAFLSADDENLANLRRELEKDYSVVIHPPEAPGYITDLELIRRDVNKGLAIPLVCAACGVPADRSVAFGDSMNDREMFAAAAVRVAMGNGDEGIKARADYICGAVADDGLPNAFRDLGLI